MRKCLPDDLKFMGPIRMYELVDGHFKKTYSTTRKLDSELMGHRAAAQGGIPMVRMVAASGMDIVFEAIDLPRLDQVFAFGIDLSRVREAGAMIARLHSLTRSECEPDLTRPREYIFILLEDLHSFGDTPISVHEDLVMKINRRLEDYRSAVQTCYIHGDFTPQNIFVGPNLIPFDWEDSCYSDPAYDLATFVAFLMQFMTQHERSFGELIAAEKSLLDGYRATSTLPEDVWKRFQFYKVFLRHTMYWFYLFLLRELSRLTAYPTIRGFLDGTIEDPDEAVRAVHSLGFLLKRSSLHRIYRMLNRSPGEFILPCDLSLDSLGP